LSRIPHRGGKPWKRDLEGLWAARRGQCRVVYEVLEDVFDATVVRVAHRADVYH
jgi:mRNA interferase RelE/StbE